VTKCLDVSWAPDPSSGSKKRFDPRIVPPRGSFFFCSKAEFRRHQGQKNVAHHDRQARHCQHQAGQSGLGDGFQVGVPEVPIAATELLPLAQNLSNAIVDATMQEIETRGGKISCCKGCGACCRQLVPISDVEARYIAELVESLPEPRRSQVKARFEDAVKRLAEAGLLEKLRQPERWHREGSSAWNTCARGFMSVPGR
jgi:hypothetical protein